MVSKARRTREKLELRHAILAAAQQIAAAEGWQAVTIRRIADEVEYSPPTIYEHFENKEAILFEVLKIGFAQLAEALRPASTHADADEALVGMVRAYCTFAWDAPALYEVMHGIAGVPLQKDQKPEEIKASYLLLLNGIERFATTHNLRIENYNERVEMLWSAAHGIVSLTLTGRIGTGPETACALAEQTTRALLAAWRLTR